MEEDKMMKGCKVLVIGGSAGSLEVVLHILPRITAEPSKFAIVIIMHRKSGQDTILEDLIAVKTAIPVQLVEDKTAFHPGFVYIAPSDYHMLFEKNHTLSLDTSEKVNYSRPSIDVSFESAADVYGRNVMGILLSGANSDGTDGLKAIKRAGGTTIVQDPKTADMPFMPNFAIANTTPDHVLTPEGIVAFINLLG